MTDDTLGFALLGEAAALAELSPGRAGKRSRVDRHSKAGRPSRVGKRSRVACGADPAPTAGLRVSPGPTGPRSAAPAGTLPGVREDSAGLDHTFFSVCSHGSAPTKSLTSRALRTRRGTSQAAWSFLKRISTRQSFFWPSTTRIW